MNYVDTGFIGIDSDGKVLPGFTERCRQLIYGNIEVGANFISLLGISERCGQQMVQAMNQIFDDRMPESVTLSQLPKVIEGAMGSLGLSASVIRSEVDNSITALLLTLTDRSSLESAERKIKQNEMLMSILRERDAFDAFLIDFKHECLEAANAAHYGNQIRARELLHTLKGNLAIFGLNDAVGMIHDLEDRKTIEAFAVEDIVNAVTRILHDNETVLELEHRQKYISGISEEDIHYLRSTLKNIVSDPKALREIEGRLDRLMNRPISFFLGPIKRNVEDIAEKLGKQVSFELRGGQIKIPQRCSSLIRNLSHIIRNALDHGIEPIHERGDKGEVGQVILDCNLQDENLTITISDDGRGLSKETIKEKALEIGLYTKDQLDSFSEQELIELIFHPAISTADSVTEVSGRGVGMSSVKEVVDSLGGRISLSSVKGRGTIFTIAVDNIYV